MSASPPPSIAISRTSIEPRTSSTNSAKKPTEVQPPRSPLPNAHSPPDYRWYHRSTRIQTSQPTPGSSKHTPEVEWHIKWDKTRFPNGRVLIIDYVSNQQIQDVTPTQGDKRHLAVVSQEFEDLISLKNFYADSKRVHQAALRVIHVQNATWATLFLQKKFNIDNSNELIGMLGFRQWVRAEKPRQRNGRPFPNGRSFGTQTDPWRNISRTAFGFDYLKTYRTIAPNERKQRTPFEDGPYAKMMHLKSHEGSRSPYGYDVSVQRISVYVQRNLGPPGQVSPDVDVKNPYATHFTNGHRSTNEDEDDVGLEYLDNTNTVIVFETSASMLLQDCLVQPRNQLENRWRRLSFYLKQEEALNDSRLAAQCTDFILSDIFHGLAITWEVFLSVATDHVSMLEDKIYESPADESRAPELWVNQAAWQKVDKIMYIHQDLVKETQNHLHELADVDQEEGECTVDSSPEWLSTTPAEYERLGHSIQEDLVQPTINLSDLMYKSVAIRDSRQSLHLGLSLWRLSWITFIFLPLTFLVSFFGMNVDLFRDPFPSVWWYFLAAGLLMIIVLIMWYCIKHSLQRARQTPYQRGLYKSLFTDLEEEYPMLWSSSGAVPTVAPCGTLNKLKWRLLKRWFSPQKTIDKRLYSSLDPGGDVADLGSWATFKRYLLRRWLPDIHNDHPYSEEDGIALAELGNSRVSLHTSIQNTGSINQLAKMSTPIAVADAVPGAVQQISQYGLRPLGLSERRNSSGSRHSDDRPSSRGSSGIMIEERILSDSETDAEEHAIVDSHEVK